MLGPSTPQHGRVSPSHQRHAMLMEAPTAQAALHAGELSLLEQLQSAPTVRSERPLCSAAPSPLGSLDLATAPTLPAAAPLRELALAGSAGAKLSHSGRESPSLVVDAQPSSSAASTPTFSAERRLASWDAVELRSAAQQREPQAASGRGGEPSAFDPAAKLRYNRPLLPNQPQPFPQHTQQQTQQQQPFPEPRLRVQPVQQPASRWEQQQRQLLAAAPPPERPRPVADPPASAPPAAAEPPPRYGKWEWWVNLDPFKLYPSPFASAKFPTGGWPIHLMHLVLPSPWEPQQPVLGRVDTPSQGLKVNVPAKSSKGAGKRLVALFCRKAKTNSGEAS